MIWQSGSVSRSLANTHAVICASPAYIEKFGLPSTPEALSQHQVISFSYLPSGDVWHFQSASGETRSVTLKPRMHSNNGETIRAVVIGGQGIAMQPIFEICKDLQEGRLVTILPDWYGPTFGIHAVYPSRKNLSLKIKILIDYLAEKLAGTAWQAPAK